MTSWHVRLFDDPRCDAARRITDLQDRRGEVRNQAHTAAAKQAEQRAAVERTDDETRRVRVRARLAAHQDHADATLLAVLHDQSSAAQDAQDQAAREVVYLEAGIAHINAEITETYYIELLDELLGAYYARRANYTDHLTDAEQDAGAASEAAARVYTLTTAIRPQSDGHQMRQAASLKDLHRSLLDVVPDHVALPVR
jgi:hypothetical protein